MPITETNIFACAGGSIQARDAEGALVGNPFVTKSLVSIEESASFDEKTNLDGQGGVLDSARTDAIFTHVLTFNRYPVAALPALFGHTVTDGADSTTIDKRGSDRGAVLDIRVISGKASSNASGVEKHIPFAVVTTPMPSSIMSQEFVSFTVGVRAEKDPSGVLPEVRDIPHKVALDLDDLRAA